MAQGPPDVGTESEYAASCRKKLWQEVFRIELAYLARHLEGCRDVLSVGCGPAIIEGGLAELGFRVTGLDVSRKALRYAPDTVHTVVARAEDMPFPADSFDAVISVVSLQFLDDWRLALEKMRWVLRPCGRIILLLLNPDSDFFRRKSSDPDSYISKIRHVDLTAIEEVVAQGFSIVTEYFLHIDGETVSAESGGRDAVLYIIRGTKRKTALSR